MAKADPDSLTKPKPAGDPGPEPKEPKGSELRSWCQIIELYGGDCLYQLMACGEPYRFDGWTEKAFFGDARDRQPSRNRKARRAAKSQPKSSRPSSSGRIRR